MFVDLTKIDKWFLYKLKNIVDCTVRRFAARKTSISNFDQKELEEVGSLFGLKKELLHHAKKLGFGDKQIAIAVNSTEDEVRSRRKGFGLTPFVKKIDTLAAEFVS
jgi:carbamoyl-phosphate synthase large subunit